ncbi:uncharacterized protein BXZ73DRAFT_55393 [Epithele typhae]|uniref:uncharacterized protein n=1 Tax=Epithele typhae TaxID=378194 RepID=UPI0020087608|nr:uncharacterized protein BXZ73DRAFT_55393 [Epithele typhae]KAH9913681.1 hypothetical protein BXZ73DRAFT_55393 [Epithele typhae]
MPVPIPRRPAAPISRLPVELLSTIFLLTAHTPDQDTDEEDQGSITPCLSLSSTTPDVLAAVCKHWREVALGTPRLWTRICVTIGDIVYSRRGEVFASAARYAARSSKCALDIFIDARDPEWDFSEHDPYIDDPYDYKHPFQPEHMRRILSILLPHARRFRTLAVLTDRWEAMHTTLDCLSMEPAALVSGSRPLPPSLPLLESLVLMRCNEFVSYHPDFTPAGRQDAPLPFSALLRQRGPAPVLPRLKTLVLSGVHTQWALLPHLLPPPCPAASTGLETLELSYHSASVRPTERELRALLTRCSAHLTALTVRVSGPRPSACASPLPLPPVALPALATLTLGYDDAHAAAVLVSALHAPHATALALEDASCPAREDAEDAEPLLDALARVAGRAFPAVRALAMRQVDAPAEAFEALYGALPALRALAVEDMFLLGGAGLAREVEVAFAPPAPPSLPSGRMAT